MSGQHVSQIIGILVIIYLTALLGIARYLRIKHKAVWQSLGGPGLTNWFFTSFKLAGYVLFSGAFRQLADRRLTLAIYATRGLVLALVATIVYWKLAY